MLIHFNSLQLPQAVSFDTAASWVLKHLNPNATDLFEKKPTAGTGEGHAYARQQSLECLAQRGGLAIAAFKIEQQTSSTLVVGRNNDLFSQVYLEPWRMMSLDVKSDWSSGQRMFAYQLEGVHHSGGHINSLRQGFHCLPETANLTYDYVVFYWLDDDQGGGSVVAGVEEVKHVPHDSNTGTSVVLNNGPKMAIVLNDLAFNENRFDRVTKTVVDQHGDEVAKTFRVIHVNMNVIATLRENPGAMEVPILSELNTDDWDGIRGAADLPPVTCGRCLNNGAGVCTWGQEIDSTPRYARKHLTPTQKAEALALGWRKRNVRWRHPQNMNENGGMALRMPVVDSSSSSSFSSSGSTSSSSSSSSYSGKVDV
jgi:hypothetical protein